MAAAFGAMMLSPMVMNQEIGFALSLAVILDATLMRMVVVPSVMVLMKKYNWWMPVVKSEEQKKEEEKRRGHRSRLRRDGTRKKACRNPRPSSIF